MRREGVVVVVDVVVVVFVMCDPVKNLLDCHHTSHH